MRPYLCISHAPEDAAAADRLIRELTRYGFFSLCAEADASPAERSRLASGARMLLLFTSLWAENDAGCASDVWSALSAGVPVVCLSREPNAMNDRFCNDVGGAVLVRMPGEDADEAEWTAHRSRLYVEVLCRDAACFSPIRCVDDAFGRLVTVAVRAWAGDRGAQWQLGQAFEHGTQVPVSPETAARWTAKAAAQGLPDALIRLGEYKLDGEGTSRDPDGALSLFRRAAAAGDARGVYYVGLCSLNGYGMPVDPAEAVRALREAAESGYTPARYKLALLYRDGVGTRADWRAAVEALYIACAGITGYRKPDTRIGAPPPPDPWSVVPLMDRRPVRRRRSALDYHCISMRQMREKCLSRLLFPDLQGQDEAYVPPLRREAAARCMQRIVSARRTAYAEDAWLGLPPDPARDVARLNKINGYTRQQWDVSLAACALGRMLEKGSPDDGIRPAPVQALRWYRRAAERGHSGAMFRLGDCYRRGVGVPHDRVKAFELYGRAARLGSERGQFALGVCYEYGEGVARDPAAAARWYESAARGGYAPAQNNLGGCYEYGVGVEPDMEKAVAWYTRAAEAGQADAACRLGLCCELGKGVPQDPARAYRLYEQAARKEHAYALYRLGLCCDRGIGPSSDDGARTDEPSGDASALPIGGRTVDPEAGPLSDEPFGTPQFAYAAQLYERAARRGVADAAYALGLCCRGGRGVRRDGVRAYEWFCAAAERGSIQGALEAGLCAFEGRDAIQNRVRAVSWFREAAEYWKEKQAHERSLPRTSGQVGCGLGETLPVDGMSSAEAAGRALYMLGYCTLYGLGQTDRALPDGCPAVTAAKRFFEQAASAGDTAALTALGDLYTFGLLKPDGTPGARPGQADAATESLPADPAVRSAAAPYYLLAIEGASAETADRRLANARMRAMISLSDGLVRSIPEDGGMFTAAPSGEGVRSRVWRLLTEANRMGSDVAAVRMAECACNGWGTAADPEIARGLLERAERLPGRHAKASLWRGLFLQAEADEAPDRADELLASADEAYRRAIAAANTRGRASVEGEGETDENGLPARLDYELRERRILREREEAWARAEAEYRLAVLLTSRTYPGAERREAFARLVSAVLDGHTAAVSDLSLMYAAEAERQAAENEQLTMLSARSRRRRLAEEARELARQTVGAAIPDPDGSGKHRMVSGLRRDPVEWMTDHYAADPREPIPFLQPDTPDAPPAGDVTPVMIAEAMNYLGDCLFGGYGLPSDPAAAVSCYRRAAGTVQGRGEPAAGGIVWAQYSLGWCLLHGVGVKRDPREAVSWFNRCAKLHPQAAYCLAWCHEHGEGVDSPNDREAIKYYRRALSLGYRPAKPRLSAAERRLEKALEEKNEE